MQNQMQSGEQGEQEGQEKRDDRGKGALVAGDQYERMATVWFLVQHGCALALAVPTASLEQERGTEATVN